MKRFLMIFLAVSAMILMMMPVTIGEAVDAAPDAPVPVLAQAEFMNPAALGTFVGAMAAAEALFLVIKWIAKLEGNAARIVVVICSVFTVGAGRVLSGEVISVGSIIMTVINGALVAVALMKLYEVTAGYSKTPAGNIP